VLKDIKKNIIKCYFKENF